ncbi:hypothetical protein B0H10DRAFT_2103818 [Mycena sp. CBHHK59/15]|nr:hypothetical protein B0H10DRAFT_2103818 [Mycena sp. CBHHK59/15]
MPTVANHSAPVPINDSVQLLGEYRDMATDLENEAQATSQAFSNLNNTIMDFTALFATFADSQDSADHQMIDILNGDIANLQTQIDGYNTELSRLSKALEITAFATGALALLPGAGLLFVVAGAGALIGEGVEWDKVGDERSDATKLLHQDQSEVAQLQAQLNVIDGAKYTLSEIQNSTYNMGQQLQGFTSIWNAVRSDCDAVAEYLKFIGTNTSTILPLIFWGTVNNIDCLYESMATGLINYSIGIAGSGIPPPSKRGLDMEDFPAKLHDNVEALVAATLAKDNGAGT